MQDENPNGSNPTDNPLFSDILAQNVNRRSLLGGALGVAATQFLAGGVLSRSATATSLLAAPSNGSALGFAEVLPSAADTVTVPPGYVVDVLLPWGDPILPGVAAFQEDASNSAADQEGQVGFNHDGIHYVPLANGNPGNSRGLLVMNHEYTDANQIYSAAQGSTITPDAAGAEKVAKALAGHGVTVVEIEKNAQDQWSKVLSSPYNRRVTGTTPMAFSGPVSASHPMLQSTVTPTPIGTLNNCGHGFTPWGTYLAAEENFNGYFGTAAPGWTPTPLESRYGINPNGFGYSWHVANPRFDLDLNRNELNRFGWMVEIDPFDPTSTPIKRTALGRFKHEGAMVTVSRARVCVYSGDDENGDYIYKFVGTRPWQSLIAQGMSPLDVGVLCVAKFDENGTGVWVPLLFGTGPFTPANGWVDQADVLIRTRMAADAVGATRMHRPEWIAENPTSKDVFVALTNGTGNNAAYNSGRDPNPYGHIVRLREPNGDHTLRTFEWDIFILAGDPAYDSAVPATQSIFGSPDGLWCDRGGRLWIQTDISNSSQNRADRGYDNIGNNQMLAADPQTGDLRRFLVGPRGCEITGVITTPDQKTMFVNVQHPGESTSFWNTQFGAPSVANPTTVSAWPYGGRPRPATLVIRKLDGGKIGT